jgi:cytochrome c553
MKPSQRVALIVVVLAAGLVALLALRNRQPPVLPANADHASFSSAEQCLACHGPAGVLPRSKNHPLGAECLRCHGFR